MGLPPHPLTPNSRLQLQMPVASPGYHLCLGPTSYRLEVPATHSLGLVHLLEGLTKLIGTFYLLDYWFIIKGTARWRTCIGQGMRKGHRASMFFPSMPLCLKPQMFTNPEALQTLSIWGFVEASFHRHD